MPDSAAENEKTAVRPMTMHDRYCLMRQNAGHVHVILHIITYPAPALPSRAQLEARVDDLQAALPMLSARLVDVATNHPGFVPGEAWPASAIVHESSHPGDDVEVYKAAMDAFSAAPLDGPMWRLTLFRGEGVGYLALAFNHCIVDGRGSTLLVRALTEDLGAPSAVASEEWAAPTRFDDTVSTAPSLPFLLPIVFRELLLPKMPLFVQRPFTSADPWPGKIPGDPMSCGWGIRLLSIPQDTVAAAKAAAQAAGVRTLHPLLKGAYLAALWRVFGSIPPLKVAANTARSERDPTLGHAAITHNYVSSTEYYADLAGTDSFWDRTEEIQAKVLSPAGVAEGRMTMGLLKHIPDPDVDAEADGFDEKQPTGWEKFFVARATSGIPFRDSVSVSNLGPVTLPPGATDAWWGQTASPMGGAFMVNVIGHAGGVRLTSAFRTIVSDGERTDKLHETMRRVLDRVASGESAHMTLAQITA